MPKIRDLGISAIPEKKTRPENGLDGLFAACPHPSQCPETSGCPGHSAQCEPCSAVVCSDPSGPGQQCTDCTACTGMSLEGEKKHKALTREGIAQLQHQLQQKIATSLTI